MTLIVGVSAVASLISAVVALIKLIYDIHKDKKQKGNPPHQG